MSIESTGLFLDFAIWHNHIRRAFIREVTENPKLTLKELLQSSAEMGKPAGQTSISAALQRAFESSLAVCLTLLV